MTAFPVSAGIGLKARHAADLLKGRPTLGFLEIHAENYMSDGGALHRQLAALTEHYPLSIHGVGLSLGGDEPLDLEHLERLLRLVDRYRPALVSEHLAWSGIGGNYLNDLLPIPYDEDSLAIVARHVDQVQDRLGRSILIENPAVYVAFEGTLAEPQFLAELSRRTGCGLLLDLNNLYVSHRNVGLAIQGYMNTLPTNAVGEIHLAGHHVRRIRASEIRIDDHGSRVCDEVWALYRQASGRFGKASTLIEWDTDPPDLSILLEETRKADRIRAEEMAHHAPAA